MVTRKLTVTCAAVALLGSALALPARAQTSLGMPALSTFQKDTQALGKITDVGARLNAYAALQNQYDTSIARLRQTIMNEVAAGATNAEIAAYRNDMKALVSKQDQLGQLYMKDYPKAPDGFTLDTTPAITVTDMAQLDREIAYARELGKHLGVISNLSEAVMLRHEQGNRIGTHVRGLMSMFLDIDEISRQRAALEQDYKTLMEGGTQPLHYGAADVYKIYAGLSADFMQYLVRMTDLVPDDPFGFAAYGIKDHIARNPSSELFDRFVGNTLKAPVYSGEDRISAYTLTIEGRELVLFVNETTNQVMGYGRAGFQESVEMTSLVNHAQGVFVGIKAGNQILGGFLGISAGDSLANMFELSPGLGYDDATGMAFYSIPVSSLQDGGSGTITARIYTGDPMDISGFVAQTLSYTVQAAPLDPLHTVGTYDLTPGTSEGPVTYQGFGRILSQDRLSRTDEAGTVMDDLGDLSVTIDRNANNGSVDFSFNGANPQMDREARVVSDRLAAAVGDLSENVLRTGVMFPLENADDINLVHFVDFAEGLYGNTPTTIGYGFGIVGTPTDPGDMPTDITATYQGGAAGYTTNRFLGNITSVAQFYGDTTIDVNFGTAAVAGTMNIFDAANNNAIDSFAMNGTVTGNGFNVNMTNSGTATGAGTGAFFGPQAAALGGQFSVTDFDGDISHDGVFWGAR